MIEARHSKFFINFFDIYTHWMLKWNFNESIIRGDFKDNGLPVLLIGNHFSWWDGFFVIHLNNRLFHRKLHIMMLEEQLEHRMFLNKAGAFSIRKGARSMINSFNYSIEILKESSNLLCLFPQGEIQTMYRYPVKFQKGWFRIVENLQNPVQIVFMANLTDYFSNRKPTLFQYIETYTTNPKGITVAQLEKAFNDHLISSVNMQKE